MEGGGEIIYLLLHCHHQNDSFIKMGSDERHFNVSLIVWDKVTRRCSQTATSEVNGEPKRIRTEVPLLTSLRLTARPNRLKLGGGRWWDSYTQRVRPWRRCEQTLPSDSGPWRRAETIRTLCMGNNMYVTVAHAGLSSSRTLGAPRGSRWTTTPT